MEGARTVGMQGGGHGYGGPEAAATVALDRLRERVGVAQEARLTEAEAEAEAELKGESEGQAGLGDTGGEDPMLNDAWTYRFHDPDDPNWTLNSYHHVADVYSIGDFWTVHEAVRPYLASGMFFVMRENVFPCWDDPGNINGGCHSMRVLKSQFDGVWEEAVISMLGENLLVPATTRATAELDGGPTDGWASVNGMSCSPKKYFSVIKIWTADQRFTERRHFAIPASYTGVVQWRSNLDNIQGDRAARGGE
jgi:hypothetical protein